MAKAQKTKRASLVAAEKALQRTLDKSGFTALKKGGTRSARPPMPERFESAHAAKYPSLNGFAKVPGKREPHPDAKQFPVANGHKQGMELVYNTDFLKQLGKYSNAD